MRRNAFTLLETLITITLVSLVFGMFVLLLRDSFQLTRRMASKDEARRAAQVAEPRGWIRRPDPVSALGATP